MEEGTLARQRRLNRRCCLAFCLLSIRIARGLGSTKNASLC
jgi:hypothetical protein